MTMQIIRGESPSLLVEVAVNGKKATMTTVKHRESGAVLDAMDVALLDTKKREAWICQMGEAHGEACATDLRMMAPDLAAGVVKALATSKPAKTANGWVAPEPWPDPVDGAELLAATVAVLRRFLLLVRPEYYDAVALWNLFAHAHDAFMFSPLLIATSPEKSSGKSRLLEILEVITPSPWYITNPSDAVLMRRVDRDHPTCLFDEADNVNWRERTALLSMLNSGFNRRSASVPRCVGEGANLDVKDFSVWSPKALACLRVPLPDTTVSRSIVLPFRRNTSAEEVEKMRGRRVESVFAPLRRQAIRWAADNLETLREAEPKPPDELSDRTADAWDPLFAIADLVGGEWPKKARRTALCLNGGADNGESVGAMLLADLRDLFTTKDTDRLSSKEILEELRGREDRPWIEWRRGEPLTARGLAQLLKPFGIGVRTVRDGAVTFKGYVAEDFIDAFTRYIPILSVTSVTSFNRNGLGGSVSVTSSSGVTDRFGRKSLPAKGVTDVTDRMGIMGAAEQEVVRLLL